MQLAYVIIYEAHTTTYYHLIHKQFMQNYMKRYERHYVIFWPFPTVMNATIII